VRFYHRTRLPYAVLLDADSGGRDLYNELIKHGIPKERIVKLNDVFPDRNNDFAIEDVLSSNFYHEAVLQSYPKTPVGQPGPSNKKRATLYDETFRATHKIGFQKKRAADTVKKLLSENKEDEETKKNLGLLSTAIVNCLRAQVTPPAVAPEASPAPKDEATAKPA